MATDSQQESRSRIERNAYATLITSDDFRPGVEVLLSSIVSTGTLHPVVVMYTEQVSRNQVEAMIKFAAGISKRITFRKVDAIGKGGGGDGGGGEGGGGDGAGWETNSYGWVKQPTYLSPCHNARARGRHSQRTLHMMVNTGRGIALSPFLHPHLIGQRGVLFEAACEVPRSARRHAACARKI